MKIDPRDALMLSTLFRAGGRCHSTPLLLLLRSTTLTATGPGYLAVHARMALPPNQNSVAATSPSRHAKLVMLATCPLVKTPLCVCILCSTSKSHTWISVSSDTAQGLLGSSWTRVTGSRCPVYIPSQFKLCGDQRRTVESLLPVKKTRSLGCRQMHLTFPVCPFHEHARAPLKVHSHDLSLTTMLPSPACRCSPKPDQRAIPLSRSAALLSSASDRVGRGLEDACLATRDSMKAWLRTA
mmetsp:Transcript_1525/g.4619  ORF Transcript_1525/g.4619 Transcript_1525/m.4619 type:complete len:240 (-) Transcript_1525:619-1338(-)